MYFYMHRWNDEDDEDAADRKTNAMTNEENNRKRTSRWNGM
jgi:hypothetical protein